VWAAWEKKEGERRARVVGAGMDEVGGKSKGKRPSVAEGAEEVKEEDGGKLVLFACRHLWHKGCLEERAEKESAGEEGKGRVRCLACI
jgi:hypothetical protein